MRPRVADASCYMNRRMCGMAGTASKASRSGKDSAVLPLGRRRTGLSLEYPADVVAAASVLRWTTSTYMQHISSQIRMHTAALTLDASHSSFC